MRVERIQNPARKASPLVGAACGCGCCNASGCSNSNSNSNSAGAQGATIEAMRELYRQLSPSLPQGRK